MLKFSHVQTIAAIVILLIILSYYTQQQSFSVTKKTTTTTSFSTPTTTATVTHVHTSTTTTTTATATSAPKIITPSWEPFFLFYILTHSDPVVFDRLMTQLYSPKHTYLVVSTNGSASFMNSLNQTLLSVRRQQRGRFADNTFLYYRPYGGARGSMAGVDQRLFAMQWAVNLHSRRWDLFVSLSGTDYPLRPLRDLEVFVGTAPHSHSFITAEPLSQQKLDHWYGPAYRPVSGPRGVTIAKDLRSGAPFWMLSAQCTVQIALNQPVIDRFKQSLAETLIPEEVFFNTFAYYDQACNASRDNAPLQFMAWTRCREAVTEGHACAFLRPAQWLPVLAAAQQNGFFFGRRFMDQHIEFLDGWVQTAADNPNPVSAWSPRQAATRLKMLAGQF